MKKIESNSHSSRTILFILIAINLVILVVSHQVYRYQVRVHTNNGLNQLKSIAELKVNQIIEWRQERLSDARYLSSSNQIKESFKLLISDPENPGYRQSLFSFLNGMFLNKQYESMVAMNRNRQIIFSLPEKDSVSNRFFDHNQWLSHQSSKRIVFNNLALIKDSVPIIQVMIPVTEITENDTLVYGWIFLNVDPDHDLLPLIKSLSIPDQSVDIWYIHHDDQKFRIINRGIRHYQIIDTIEAYASKMLNNSKSFKPHTATLFSDDQILAACYPIPEEESFLMITMNRSDMFAGRSRFELYILFFTITMMIAFTATVLYFWQKQRNEIIHLETEKRIITERLDVLSQFANDAIILYTRDYTVIQVNDKALELYGYNREEFMALKGYNLQPIRLQKQLHILHEQLALNGGYFFETTHVRKDGSEFPIEASLRFVEMMGSQCYQAIIRDVSVRKQFEMALVQSEARLKLIMNTIPHIVWTARPNGRLDYVNTRFESITGVSPRTKMFIRKVVHPDDFGRIRLFRKNTDYKIEEHQIRLRIRMADGSFRWFLFIIIPLCKDDGSVVSWYGSATDVNELELVVEERTAELSDLYNNAPCGYYTITPEGNFTKINDTTLKWLGYERDDLLNKSFLETVSPENRKEVERELEKLMVKGYLNNFPYELIRKDGSKFPVLVNATVIKDLAGNVTAIRSMIIDHTQRKRFEDEILKLNTLLQEHGYSLEATNKELEAFIYSVSHDLRAPLRAINGFTKIILDDHKSELNSVVQSLLEKVWDNANKMRQLIEDLLRLSRTNRQQLSLTVIDMNALFSSMFEEVRQNYPGQEISIMISPLPKATGDLPLLKQVISNLLSNAVKFSGKNEKSEIEIGWFQESENVVYFIKDNGIGFDMKYAENLFGVFRRLSNSEAYDGTGVGLALVKRIVERHGGRVWATGVPNGGATLYFTLPYVTIPE